MAMTQMTNESGLGHLEFSVNGCPCEETPVTFEGCHWPAGYKNSKIRFPTGTSTSRGSPSASGRPESGSVGKHFCDEVRSYPLVSEAGPRAFRGQALLLFHWHQL